MHHLLGFDEEFVRRLGKFMTDRLGIVHIHDFYYACPRVTLIDALGAFCGGAASDRCARCVAMDGTHTRYRMQHLTVADHRALFADVLARHAIDRAVKRRGGPDGGDAAGPETRRGAASANRDGLSHRAAARFGDRFLCAGRDRSAQRVGPRCWPWPALPDSTIRRCGSMSLVTPNIDRELLDIGNVTITGEYERNEMPRLIEATHARIALFLHGWPENVFLHAVRSGGTRPHPAGAGYRCARGRVRAAGFGVVYPFPVEPAEVMRTLLGVADGTIPFNREGGLPLSFDTKEGHGRLRALYQGAEVMQPRVAAPRGRRQARGR